MIQYARKHNSFIVEDDYDSEFRFNGSPVQSMHSLDPSSVIYVGTFSKTFMPSLRMGYLVLPDSLYAQLENAKYIADLHSPILEQFTMAKFIEKGFLDLHIKKMRNQYLKKRNYLIKCLTEIFGDAVRISGTEAGMHLVASFNGIYFDQVLMQTIEYNNLEISALRKHYIPDKNSIGIQNSYDNALIFGYGNTSFEAIEAGILRLQMILSS